nr:PREDICTED: E3 ubiquitin-protein ligase TRAIP-like [Linepithema humile]
MTLVCVICSDLLISSDDDIFSTLCGHMFHHGCLLQWLERIKTCPQCRKRTTELDIHKIYFNSSNNDSFVEDTTFCKINTIVIKSVENITNKYEEMTKQFLEQWESNLRQTLYNNVVENCALQRLIEQHCIETDEYKKYTKRLKEKIKKLQKEATNLNKKLREFKQTINQLQQKLKESNKKCKILQQQSVDIDKCKKKITNN